jgi:hypothetical protein
MSTTSASCQPQPAQSSTIYLFYGNGVEYGVPHKTFLTDLTYGKPSSQVVVPAYTRSFFATDLFINLPSKSPWAAAFAKSSGTICRTPGSCFTSTVRQILLSPWRQNANEKNSLSLNKIKEHIKCVEY